MTVTSAPRSPLEQRKAGNAVAESGGEVTEPDKGPGTKFFATVGRFDVSGGPRTPVARMVAPGAVVDDDYDDDDDDDEDNYEDEDEDDEAGVRNQFQREEAILKSPNNPRTPQSSRKQGGAPKAAAVQPLKLGKEKPVHLGKSPKDKASTGLDKHRLLDNMLGQKKVPRSGGKPQKSIGGTAPPGGEDEMVVSSKEYSKSSRRPKASARKIVPAVKQAEDEDEDEDEDENVNEVEGEEVEGEEVEGEEVEGEEVEGEEVEGEEVEGEEVEGEEVEGEEVEGEEVEGEEVEGEEVEGEEVEGEEVEGEEVEGEEVEGEEVEGEEDDVDDESEMKTGIEIVTEKKYQVLAVHGSRTDGADNRELLVEWKNCPDQKTWEPIERLRKQCPDFVKEWENGSRNGDGDIYEVEDIVDRRRFKGIVQYRVKWVGYESKHNTWEPAEILEQDVPYLVEDFEKALQEKMGKKGIARKVDRDAVQPEAKRRPGRPRK
ncbi:hypothetical protein NHQ30_005716 [Ciborinia camelliae]|nr:hypothetical protein NHQ30_005716 [Ciborinia camelliae]